MVHVHALVLIYFLFDGYYTLLVHLSMLSASQQVLFNNMQGLYFLMSNYILNALTCEVRLDVPSPLMQLGHTHFLSCVATTHNKTRCNIILVGYTRIECPRRVIRQLAMEQPHKFKYDQSG